MPIKKSLFVINLIFWSLQYTTAQVPDAVINLGILDYNSSCYSYPDSDGNIYLVGRSYYPLDFDPGPGVVEAGPPDNQVFIVKYNSSFEIEWLAHIEHATAIEPDASFVNADGGITISGFATGDPVIYATDITDTLVTQNGTPAYYISFNADGELEFARSIGGPNGSSAVYIRGIYQDGSGNITIGGYYIGNCDFDPTPSTFILSGSVTDPYGFIAKYNNAGNLIWAKKIGSGTGSVAVQDMAIDHTGNIILGGYFAFNVDFNPDPLVTNNVTALDVLDGYLAKYDADGNYLWAGALAENESFGGVKHIIIDQANNIIIDGSFNKKCDFDLFAGVKNRKPSGSQSYIAKYDADGNYKWVKNASGTGDCNIWQINVDAAGNIYSTGLFKGTFDFDFGAGVFNMTGPDPDALHTDIFVHKMDKKGNFKYAFQLSPEFVDYSGQAIGMQLSITPDDQLILTAKYDGTLDVDPTAGENIIVEAGYGNSGFVARYSQPVLKYADENSNPVLQIFPSPAADHFTIVREEGELSGVYIADMQGCMVRSWQINDSSGQTFDISALPSGTYSVIAIIDGIAVSKSIQVIH